MSESVLQLRPQSCQWIANRLALWFPIPIHSRQFQNPSRSSIKPASRDQGAGRWLYSQGEARISIAWLSPSQPPTLLVHVLDSDPQTNLIIRAPITPTHLSVCLLNTTTTESQCKSLICSASGIDHRTSTPSSSVFSLKFKDDNNGNHSAISCAAIINSILQQTIQYHPCHDHHLLPPLQQDQGLIITGSTTRGTAANDMMMMDDQSLSLQILQCLEDPDFMDFVDRLEQLYIELENTPTT